ncbi:MAG: NADH-quinone oxidoreductase subunit F, partial [Candidatus Zixiibacteriota bacterium]
MRLKSVSQLEKLREQVQAREAKLKHRIIVCHGPGCLANGAEKVGQAFEKELKKRKMRGVPVTALKRTGCHGLCEKSPLVAIEPEGILYTRVKPKDVPRILDETVGKGRVIEGLLYGSDNGSGPIAHYRDIPFYAKQKRIALRHLGKIEAANIEEYIGVGGYAAAAKALTKMTPDKVIDEITTSGLRGRGGGGFPTGRKWRTCADVPVTPRYVICNGDEGDPGAFMDRAIMEGDPHVVLEGMIICAFAIGAEQGYI